MKNFYQFDLFNLPEIVRVIATGVFGFLAYLGDLFLLLVFVDLISEPHLIDKFTWGALLVGLPGTGIGWLGLYCLNKFEQLGVRKSLDRRSYFLA
ncbi:hypothetical protein DI392_10325 [Vibrio albus]|uniref:Uncharacterized protein n=1 Tax=Vibrio albus TaxID=2200953 RepID=A0A2U3B8Y6_9VIBR|nr:hypothetical protein [Vibrio albus]PWI33248.1 hypothetical protein DI392_10325 [Vibrio albus]